MSYTLALSAIICVERDFATKMNYLLFARYFSSPRLLSIMLTAHTIESYIFLERSSSDCVIAHIVKMFEMHCGYYLMHHGCYSHSRHLRKWSSHTPLCVRSIKTFYFCKRFSGYYVIDNYWVIAKMLEGVVRSWLVIWIQIATLYTKCNDKPTLLIC